MANHRKGGFNQHVVRSGKMKQKWVEVRNANRNGGNRGDAEVDKEKVAVNVKKEICAAWCEEQKDRLKRSLLDYCIQPIDFRKTMNHLLDNWNGPRDIECKDVGPYWCLITFSSQEIKEESIKNELLTSTFDEIRPHWEYFSNLSRRVWIELMGLPIGLWNKETFNRFANLWGKMVKMDDRTEESKSFTTARFIIDCFQWERVHEWISVKVDGRVFEVFAKEFGSEVYSVQSHPDLEEVSSTWREEEETPLVASMVAETSAVCGTLSVEDEQHNSKVKLNWDPLQKVTINCKSLSVLDCNQRGGGWWIESGLGDDGSESFGSKDACGPGNPLVMNALRNVGRFSNGPRKQPDGLVPNPIGVRSIEEQSRVPVLQTHDGENQNLQLAAITNDTQSGHSLPKFQNHRGSYKCVVEGGCETAVSIAVVLPTDPNRREEERSVENQWSEESLYLINECASGWRLLKEVARASKKYSEGECEEYSVCNDEDQNPVQCGDCLVSAAGVCVSTAGANEQDRDDLVDDIKESEEEGRRADLTVTKKVWDKCGVTFYNSEEEEVITRLAERKIVGKGRIDLRQKKQKQGRRAPCLEGRILATRTLRVASKSKSK
ncbi:hypothetical protein PIB30_082633 [Stylosanthes scabra]|uniref:DUF4283 domain-containing protein n=1 Tax=Stylosanthes scabra TaxID=79078 RepID=A0ABU6XQK9_9FABA|nr:hypothetical protein [Stylosanthes scabra]